MARPSVFRFLACFIVAVLSACGSARAQVTIGAVTLTHCVKTYEGLCGSIVVPLDPAGRVPGSIEVGFELYRHTDLSQPSLGTIAAQEGGPGYSTTGSRDGYVRLFTPLRDRRDILLIDKRGTGKSGAIDCRQLQHGKAIGLEPVRSCGAQLGRSAWLYSSAYAADDMAAVLRALGTGPVDYYGDSYGTFFGQVFATRHPDLVRSIVLDSAYPTRGGTPYFASEIENGPVSLEKVCARSPSCRALTSDPLGSSVTARFQALLDAVRKNPVSGVAPGGNGGMRRVTADAPALFAVFYNVGNNLIAYRDLDAAARAYLEQGDSLPLLRLVAEAEAGNSSGGPANQFSDGLFDAVICADYQQLYDLRARQSVRSKQYAASLARKQANDPDVYAPFTLDEAVGAPGDPESLDTCTVWPRAPDWANPGVPVPENAVFPAVPVLVLAGELDTVTSPKEAAQTTALFPKAWFVVVKNSGHETAVGDGGVFVPPYGGDLARCAGPIVLNFIASGGDPGDTSCALDVRPIRTVPSFATHWTDVPPASAAPSNAADPGALSLASAAAETVGDAVARYFITLSGSGSGLRGGKFRVIAKPDGYRLHLDSLRWTEDLALTGSIEWNQLDGRIYAKITAAAPGHTAMLTIAWNDRETDAKAHISGQVDGQAIEATRIAP